MRHLVGRHTVQQIKPCVVETLGIEETEANTIQGDIYGGLQKSCAWPLLDNELLDVTRQTVIGRGYTQVIEVLGWLIKGRRPSGTK